MLADDYSNYPFDNRISTYLTTLRAILDDDKRIFGGYR